jgi:hypothetical protein
VDNNRIKSNNPDMLRIRTCDSKQMVGGYKGKRRFGRLLLGFLHAGDKRTAADGCDENHCGHLTVCEMSFHSWFLSCFFAALCFVAKPDQAAISFCRNHATVFGR